MVLHLLLRWVSRPYSTRKSNIVGYINTSPRTPISHAAVKQVIDI